MLSLAWRILGPGCLCSASVRCRRLSSHRKLPQQVPLLSICTLGGGYSLSTAINARGQVVGNSGTAAQETHAFLWDKGGMRDLGTLGGAISYAGAINACGQVVGTSLTKGGEFHAFWWDKGGMVDLGTLGGSESYATAVNDGGQVVGASLSGGREPCLPVGQGRHG